MTSNIITDLTNLVPGTFYRMSNVPGTDGYYGIPCGKNGEYDKSSFDNLIDIEGENIILFLSLFPSINRQEQAAIVFFLIKRNMFFCMPNFDTNAFTGLEFEEI